MLKNERQARWNATHPELHRKYMMTTYLRKWREYAEECPEEAAQIIAKPDRKTVADR